MKKLSKYLLCVTVIATPFGASASGTLFSVLNLMSSTVFNVGKISILLAFAVFFYGLARFILAAGDPKEVEAGKGILTWGTIAIFVILSITGIIGFLDRSLGTDRGPGNIHIVVPNI